MKIKAISIYLDEEHLSELNERARSSGMCRGAFIKSKLFLDQDPRLKNNFSGGDQ